ncbi:MAG: MmoB/DmpM family protein [Alphaproteobacteria bacterium]|nr:MmoB/DmpM family protein [Alphaproteobacteria bacterium]
MAGTNKVGPVLMTGEIADAAIVALDEDNPGKEFDIEDHEAYIRIQTDDDCIIRRATMEKILGRPFVMQELEVVLSTFAGRIDLSSEHARFYFEKKR